MPSELDRRFDEELARVVGPGGRLVVGQDEAGRAIVENFPATLPEFFRAFCALNADNEAVVAGEERFTFADLDRLSDRVARGLAARGIGKGNRVGLAMRNCPVAILAYMGILKAGGVATLLNGWWEPAEMEHAIRLTEPGPDHRRCTAGKAHCRTLRRQRAGEHRHRSADRSRRCSHCLAMTSVELPALAPEDDATILFTSGSTGLCKGALSTHRAVVTGTYIYATGLIVLLGLLDAGRPRARDAAADLAQRSAVPRHRRSPGDAQQLRHRPLHGDHAQVGRDGGAAADREGEDHLFRRRPDDEPRADDPSRPAQIRPVVAQGHHRGRRAAPGQPRRAPAPRVPGRAAGARLRTDRDQRGRLPELLEQLRRQAGVDRPRRKPFVEVVDPSARATGRSRLARSAKSRSAPPRTSNAIGAIPTPRRPCSRRTGSSAPATSAISTRTAICSSSTARRTSSSAAARISRPRRSRRNVYACPAVAEVSVFGAPDERLGEVPVAIVLAKDGERLERGRASRLPRRTAREIQNPRTDHLRRRAAAPPRHRQDRPPRAEGAVRALKVDRRTLLIGGGAGVGLIVAFALWPRHLRERSRHWNTASRRSATSSRSRATGGSRSRCRRSRRARASGPRLPQIVADELGAAWETIAVEPAPLTGGYANPLAKDEGWPKDSRITADFDLGPRIRAGRLRDAAAVAREMLVGAAADRWNVEPERLRDRPTASSSTAGAPSPSASSPRKRRTAAPPLDPRAPDEHEGRA